MIQPICPYCGVPETYSGRLETTFCEHELCPGPDLATLRAEAEKWRFQCPAPDFTSKAKPGKSVKVQVPHSISYNGGTVIKGKWYSGYTVPDPIVPEGYELVSDGGGSELNAHPPYVTRTLRERKPR